MPRTDLSPLFLPRRIGIVGLSNRRHTWGRMVLQNLRDGGFTGEIIAIAPRSATDVPSVADLAELDEPLDLLLVAVPAAAVPGVVARARATGNVRSVLVLSAGFSESGEAGAELERQLVAAADGLPVVGPNCVGLLSRPGNAVATVSAYVAREHPPTGPVAIVSQSGALGFVMATLLERHGVAISSYVSVGNEACLGIGEIGAHLLEQPDVSTLGLYIESVRDPAGLRELGDRAAELGKRVVALKAGTSAAGQRATLSHTAAVAGDALLFRGLCDDAGIITADSDEAFADLLHAAQSDARLPPLPRLAIVTMTGGGGAILADRLSAHGAAVPPLSPQTRERIEALGLTSLASSTNPIDLGGNFDRDADRFGDLLALLDDDPDVDGIVGMFTFGDRNPDWYRDLAGDLSKLRTPAWMIWAAGTAADRAGTPPGTVFDTIESFVRGLPAARTTIGSGPVDQGAAPAGAVRALRAPKWAEPGDRVLSEADAREVVQALGVPYAPTAVITADSDVDGLLPELPASTGYVVKVDSPEVAHRAQLGLVRLGVPAGDVPATVRDLFDAARRHGVTRCRVLVQPKLEHRGEIVVGGIRDPQYGPSLLVGAGGARVEAADAPRYGVPLPARAETLARTAADVAFRHGPLDTDALTDLLIKTGRLLTTCPEIAELDINPLLIRPDGELIAVDALAVRI